MPGHSEALGITALAAGCTALSLTVFLPFRGLEAVLAGVEQYQVVTPHFAVLLVLLQGRSGVP
ncbi:hypothetical protein [Streptomyces jumonjinensis]|uniref:Uncharacterized protein n=1 Tax=Streptomyces jumonjinensis TaxID=1945 RepID=A0A646KBV4_STRJU|nr:hypothetical protein [Streptomyces jumonjinensis]MQS99702.1 hypothetical protein [Streptomyces jumonjinensis]